MKPTALERLQQKYTVTKDGCWQWFGASNQGGYGRFRHDGAMRSAHRVAYELLVGPIPDGLDLDHLCRNRACVNPAHLDPVTRSENLRRGEVGKAHPTKTHCPQNHPYDEENTGREANGWRFCKTCRRDRDRRRRAQRSAA